MLPVAEGSSAPAPTPRGGARVADRHGVDHDAVAFAVRAGQVVGADERQVGAVEGQHR